MVNPTSVSQDGKGHRWLRVTTVLAFVPAFALLLPFGIITARPLPTVGIAAMFFSAAFGTLVLGGAVRSPGVRACCGLLLAASIAAILLPTWMFMPKRHGFWWTSGEGLTLLASYGITPMLLNFTLHIFAALHNIYTNVHVSWKTATCPSCHHNIIRVSRSAAGQESDRKYTVRKDARFYDDDERVSSEFQTSGFNTPRQSEETLASSTRTSRDLPKVDV